MARSREPHLDVFDEAEDLVVVAQLPGVEDGAFALEVEGDILVITATARSGAQCIEYRGEELFPFPVAPEPASVSFTNYMLEARFRRKSTKRSAGRADDSDGDNG